MPIIKKQDADETDTPPHTITATGDTQEIQYQLYVEI
jgi:ubiquitin